MNTQEFIRAFNKSRNGCDHFIRHPLAKIFIYSDGVQECFEAGTYWMGDIIATECAPLVLQAEAPMGTFYAVAKDGKADLRLEITDYAPVWTRHIHRTDLPDGTWAFCLGNDGDNQIRMILVSEY